MTRFEELMSETPFEEPPMTDHGVAALPLWAAILVVTAVGMCLAGLFAWVLT